jgi:hypothetical protein
MHNIIKKRRERKWESSVYVWSPSRFIYIFKKQKEDKAWRNQKELV